MKRKPVGKEMSGREAESLRSSNAGHGGGLASTLMLVATFCWASNIVAGKVALSGFDPLALAQLRMAGAASLYILLYILWRGFRSLPLTKREWLTLALMALTGITLNQICYTGGLARTSVIHTGLIQAIGPVMVLLMSAFLGIEALTYRKILGMSIAFVGVALLLIEKPGPGSGASWLGDLIVIAASAFFGYYTVLMKRVAHRYDPLTLNALVFGLGAIFLIPFSADSLIRTQWRLIPYHAWWGLVYMVLFGSLVAYLIYAFALEHLSPSSVAAFAYLEPLMAALMGVWLLGEKVSVAAMFGGALILFGVYFTQHGRGQRKVSIT